GASSLCDAHAATVEHAAPTRKTANEWLRIVRVDLLGILSSGQVDGRHRARMMPTRARQRTTQNRQNPRTRARARWIALENAADPTGSIFDMASCRIRAVVDVEKRDPRWHLCFVRRSRASARSKPGGPTSRPYAGLTPSEREHARRERLMRTGLELFGTV